VGVTPGGLFRALAGIGLWWLLLWLHDPVIGISPWP